MIRFRKYNTLLVTGTTAIRIPIVKRGVVDHAVGADWTPASGDVKISIDGAAPANVTNLPVATASGNSALWEFILTAAELSCKQAVITISDSATKVIEDDGFIVETFGHASAMYAADLSAANLPANIIQIAGQTAGAAGGVTFPTDPADQSLIIAATDALLAAINALNNLSAAQVRTELSTELGRIDQTISSRSSQTSVDELPTNAELATALAAADDAMLSAIGAVQSDTNDIQLRLPAALVGGKMDSVAALELTEQDIEDLAAVIAAELPQVIITPFSATVSGGEVSDSGLITAYQYTRFGPYTLTIIDSEGTPIDLRNLDLRFISYRVMPNATLSKYFEITSDMESMTVSGAGHNVLTIYASENPTQIARVGLWALRDQTNDRVLARGSLKIVAVSDAEETE